MVLVLIRLRKRKRKCGGILSSSMRYSMQAISRENRLYNHHATAELPPEEESISGCEIYGRREEILTYEQKRRFGLVNINKSTQTPLETLLYCNAQARSTIDDPFQRRFEKGRSELINTDYDYALGHQGVARSISSQTEKYSCPVRRSRRRKSSRKSKTFSGAPPPCGRQRLSSPSSDGMERISYIDPDLCNTYPDLCNTCQSGEDALSPESEPSSEADSDTESSDYDSDPPKILIDKKLIEYVRKLEKKHTVYIEKYKTPKSSHLKYCSKPVSMEVPPVGPRRRANTGVLKLLDRRKTNVGKTFSIPVNIETVSCRPCPHRQAPKPCLSEVDYLKILS
ncbi:uncharacterized protein LOC133185239 [Saccostrea echinata]|uniref:uncharacterized protein LOC133185239 n=1 Tax=Saccostrea echinata TaxID=191078 RepID=UPI002A80C504|nr:uncharacterized protein LOC133185239 [Saccostrea echinata]